MQWLGGLATLAMAAPTIVTVICITIHQSQLLLQFTISPKICILEKGLKPDVFCVKGLHMTFGSHLSPLIASPVCNKFPRACVNSDHCSFNPRYALTSLPTI
jgi:hypothetical protein